jgi:hypothetical protein
MPLLVDMDSRGRRCVLGFPVLHTHGKQSVRDARLSAIGLFPLSVGGCFRVLLFGGHHSPNQVGLVGLDLTRVL